MKPQKLLVKVLNSPHNINFHDAQSLVQAFGFRLSRTKGSHHIFVHPDVEKVVNLQSVNGKAKAYQLREFLAIVERYDLKLPGSEEGK